MKLTSGLLLAGMLATLPAAAQTRPIVTLAAEDPARWDLGGLAGWRGVSKAPDAAAFDDWYEVASFGAAAGYYWTTHLKTEVDFSTTAEGNVFIQQPISVPGQTFPTFRFGEHRFRSTSVSGGLVYQFFENAWFHPFVGAGVEGSRERGRLSLQEQPSCERTPCMPVPLPLQTTISSTARPFLAVGFKLYVSERAFIRSDLRSTLWTDGAEAVHWRAGMGVDF
jgi:opacity protein-like surface antigen